MTHVVHGCVVCMALRKERTNNLQLGTELRQVQSERYGAFSGEVQQTCPLIFRCVPIARLVTQKPFGHLSLAFSAYSGQVWLSVALTGNWGHRTRLET